MRAVEPSGILTLNGARATRSADEPYRCLWVETASRTPSARA